MSELQTIPTSVAKLVGMPVVDRKGQSCGKVHEFAVNVHQDHARVESLVLQHREGGKMHLLLVPIGDVVLPKRKDKSLKIESAPTEMASTDEHLLLERDLLDQQIIDVDGRKVVRVNDVNLAWEKSSVRGKVAGMRIEEVEVGMRGALRRLLKGLPNSTIDSIANKFVARVIPWGCVDLIERDPARRVRLKIGQERLAQLHPSDIAAILEELAPAERDAVFSSLPEETAAEALEEVEPKLQKALVAGLGHEHAADIIEEMDPGAAADLLNELSEEDSVAILEEMEPEERQDVEELLDFSPESAAGRMTTDFVSVPEDAVVRDAIEALREFEGDPDNITEVYLLGENEKLAGVVALPRLLLAKPETTLSLLAEIHYKSCELHATANAVAALFDKYNLRSLPVVDLHGRIAGTIHAEQVIAQLREG
jgi:magnesium transporter